MGNPHRKQPPAAAIMRILLVTILAIEAACGAATTPIRPSINLAPHAKDVNSADVQAKARPNSVNSFRDTLFEPGFGLRGEQSAMFGLKPTVREGLPVIIPGVPTELLIVAIIAKIILIIILSSTMPQGSINNQLSGGGNVGVNRTTPIDDTVNDVLSNNPQLLSTLASTILPGLLPLLTPEGREVDTDLIMERTDATAFARLEGVQGELYFAQIKPVGRTASSATVVAGALEGFNPGSKYKVSFHKSGDTTDSCKNVGDLYEGTMEHTFTTDSEGRSVLLLHEENIRIRGDLGIMGRSVVIKDQEGTTAYCGIIINA